MPVLKGCLRQENDEQSGVINMVVATCGSAVLKYCPLIWISRDLLFREIYDKFSEDPVGKIVFLESLEPHILADK